MENTHYKYNKKTNSYQLTYSQPNKIRNIIFLSVGFVALAGLFGYVFSGTSSHKSSDSDHRDYAAELETMQVQYEVLNKKLSEAQQVLADVQEKDKSIYRTYFGMKEIPDEVREAGFGGTDRNEKFNDLKYGDLIKNVSQNVDVFNKQLEIQEKSLNEVIKLAQSSEKMYSILPAIQPIANKNLKRIASGFGLRYHPILKISRMHKGMDFSAPQGTPVYATGDAKVENTGYNSGHGNFIKLAHGSNYESLYGHLSKIKVRRGQKVKRGDIIGYVGSTGLSTGPHLHYEIYKNGKFVNPIDYFYDDISPDEYKKLFEKSEQMSVSLD